MIPTFSRLVSHLIHDRKISHPIVSLQLILRIVNVRWEEQEQELQRQQRQQPVAQLEMIDGLAEQVRGQPCSCIDRGGCRPSPRNLPSATRRGRGFRGEGRQPPRSMQEHGFSPLEMDGLRQSLLTVEQRLTAWDDQWAAYENSAV